MKPRFPKSDRFSYYINLFLLRKTKVQFRRKHSRSCHIAERSWLNPPQKIERKSQKIESSVNSINLPFLMSREPFLASQNQQFVKVLAIFKNSSITIKVIAILIILEQARIIKKRSYIGQCLWDLKFGPNYGVKFGLHFLKKGTKLAVINISTL